MYEIIDNFLTEEKFLKVKNSILNSEFSWNLTPWVSNLNENLKTTSSYYFTHVFYSGLYVDPNSHIFIDILYQSEHIDYDYSHKGAIFYLNTNNGFTTLENGTKVESIQNRLLLFDPSKPHNSTTCTDDKCRVNVNFNYF